MLIEVFTIEDGRVLRGAFESSAVIGLGDNGDGAATVTLNTGGGAKRVTVRHSFETIRDAIFAARVNDAILARRGPRDVAQESMAECQKRALGPAHGQPLPGADGGKEADQ